MPVGVRSVAKRPGSIATGAGVHASMKSGRRSQMPLSNAAQSVIDLITQRDYVTFVEIEHVLQPLIPVKGSMAIEIGSCPNLVLWGGMSDEWVAVMHEVQASGLVSMEPTSLLTYMVDGGRPRLPVAKRPPKGGYSTEHWAPVCFRPKGRPVTRKRSKAQTRHAAQKHGVHPQVAP